MKNVMLSFLFIVILFSPVLAQTKAEKKKMKEEQAAREFENTKTLIRSGAYVFEATWATTQRGKRINLSSNSNFVRIDNREADIDLPFFGETYSAGAGMSGGAGIVYQGPLERYKVELNEKKQHFDIKFSTKGKFDQNDFMLIVYKNGNAYLKVFSNNRSNISFDGKVIPLKKGE